jgi:diguanylate cyclase (GGDEF)-like protein
MPIGSPAVSVAADSQTWLKPRAPPRRRGPLENPIPMASESTQERPLLLSALPAGATERRLALAVVSLSTIFFLVAAPFAKVRLAEVGAFLPIYQSALVINDLITAVLLFGQFGILRSQALLMLASAYLFSAVMAVAHLLSFPALFAPTGLLGAGSQTTAWLYFFWHGMFPLFVIAYALLEDGRVSILPSDVPRGHASRAIVFCVAGVFLVAGAFILLATMGHDALPAIMQGNRDAPAKVIVATASWTSSLAALAALWRRRPHSVLDVWLMVVMCVWTFDIALASVLNAGRFDVGWYAGRIYGLLATSFVLMVLLYENSMLYVALIRAHASDRKKAAELERLTTIDALTGIANRRAFDKALDQEWRRTARHGTPLSLLMIDVDSFKRFNDTYGHVAGDQCLRAIGEVLARYARRAGEVAARYGGEEFAVLLPHMDETEAQALAQRVCQAIRDLGIPHASSLVAAHVTISVGMASASRGGALPVGDAPPSSDDDQTKAAHSGPVGLVRAADRALYAAKAAGRNQISSARGDDMQDRAELAAA